MKKSIVIICVILFIIVIFYPKIFGLNENKKCIGFLRGGVQTMDFPSSSVVSNICFGIVVNTQIKENNKQTTLYQGDGFTFQYDSSATVKMESYGSGASFYDVFKTEEVNEQIRLFDEEISSFESFCGKDIEIHTTTIQAKTFTYCDSKAEPARTYFYIAKGKTIVINTQSNGSSKSYSYIIPESVQIN